jgi:hypothetical protein
MRILAFVSLILLSLVLFIQCSDNPVDEKACCGNFDPDETDSLATVIFEDLGDVLADLGDMDADDFRNQRFDEQRSGFGKVIIDDPNNAIAHLGLAIIELLELNYDQDIWEMIDSLDSWFDNGDGGGGPGPPPPGPVDRHHTLVGRQFTLLVDIPMTMSYQMVADFPPNVTADNIQTIIEDKVIPALDRAIGHITTVENDTDTAIRIGVDFGDGVEYVIIDLGEIYLFDASLRALRAAFGVATAYDVDMFGPDGTYDWLSEVRDLEDEGGMFCATYEVVPAGGMNDINLYYDYDNEHAGAMIDSILNVVLHHNLENRSSFLSLRNGGTPMTKAGADILGTVQKLEASAYFIRNIRNDVSSEHVIKLTDLTDLDSELDDPDKPNFAKDFKTVEDVLGFVHDVFSGEVPFTEELGPRSTEYTWKMNLSVLFAPSPVQDWNSLLPYHSWDIPQGNWITKTTQLWWAEDWGGSDDNIWVYHDGECQEVLFTNIGWVRDYGVFYESIDLGNMLILEDEFGREIDPDNEFPHFPDYTLNGLFPEMTRAEWENLIDILE